MRIIIPTRGRTEDQLTLQALPGELRKRTSLVCPKLEASTLYRLYPDVEVVIQPDPTWRLARKRAWIVRTWLEAGYDKILMLDDDLKFATRISTADWRLREITGQALIPEFNRLEAKLGPDYPHVGFGTRQGNNRLPAGWQSPGRQVCTLGYYLPVVARLAEVDRLALRHDMDVTLQLLRRGYPNAIWNTTVHDQRAFAPGGCSLWRTVENSDADARQLAELHPGYVTLVQRRYAVSVPRLEVVCAWSKALQDVQRSLMGRREESMSGIL
jgi:hypothetical protein